MIHLFSFLGASKGSAAPAASGAVCQHMGSLGQSTPLLPEPLDCEEALHRAIWDLLLCCQSQGEQVTFTSVPTPHQLTPLPQRNKTGEAGLAQLPHKSSSAPNLFHCPHGNHFTFCDCEFQLTTARSRQSITTLPRGMPEKAHSTPHWYYYTPCYQPPMLYNTENLEELGLPAELNSTWRPLKRSHSICLTVTWT